LRAELVEVLRRAGRRAHPDAGIVRSQPGLGLVLAARVLAEFGDDPDRSVTAKARKAYAGTVPITRASGLRQVVLARALGNRLVGILHGCLRHRRPYDEQRFGGAP
jgi:transposase